MCQERDQIMPLWSPQMKRMKNFSSLRKPRNKKQSLRNRRRVHPVTPYFSSFQNRISEDVEEKLVRHRKIVEPEVVGERDSEVEGDAWHMELKESSDEEEEEIDDEIKWRPGMMRQRAQERKNEEMEVVEVEDEGLCGEESESESKSEEYTDSEDEMEPRLKFVFIRKKDQVTVQELEDKALRQKELEQEAKCMAEERRKYTLKIVEEETKKSYRRTSSPLPPWMHSILMRKMRRRTMRRGKSESSKESSGTEKTEKHLKRRKQKLSA